MGDFKKVWITSYKNNNNPKHINVNKTALIENTTDYDKTVTYRSDESDDDFLLFT